MRHGRLTLAALGTVAALACAPSAHAGQDWTPPAQLPSGWVTASLGFATDGTALAAHVDLKSQWPLDTRLTIARRRAGTRWAPELVIDEAGGEPIDVSLAVAPSGAAVAAWQEITAPSSQSSPRRYRAAFRAPSGAWGKPVTLAQPVVNASTDADVATAIAPDGTAAAGAVVDEASDWGELQADTNVMVAVHPPGGSWGAAKRISPYNVSAAGLDLAFDGTGQLTGAWAERYTEGASSSDSDDRWRVTTRRRGASKGIWGVADDMTGSAGSVSWPLLAVGPGGHAVLAWQWHTLPDASADAWAVTRDSAGGAWSPPARVVDDVTVSPRDVGVSPDGTAYVLAWQQAKASSDNNAAAVRRPAGGAWSAPKPLRSNMGSLINGYVAFAGRDAVLAFEGADQATGSWLLQGARWTAAAAAPEAGRDIEQPDAGQGLTSLTSDRRGSVVALWGSMKLRTAAFDGGGPELAAASVPSTAVAGVALRASARFADMWSATSGQPSWDFGDGTAPVTGGTVTHTYPRPGRYTIKVRGADALWNQTTRSRTIVVSPRAPVTVPAPPTAPGADAPRITRLRVAPTRIRIGRRLPKLVRTRVRRPLGTIRFRLSEHAVVTLRFAKLGRRGASRPLRTAVRVEARKGRNRVRFAGRLSRSVALRPGRWRLTAVAVDDAGARSRRARTSFTTRR
jgi:hypothetical protein